MRRLALLRHAKSAYPEGVADHDRPLSPRGVGDARAAGTWIREHLGALDHVVVSTARRARGTWTLAAEQAGYIGAAGYDIATTGPLTIDARIYEAPAAGLLDVLRELPDRAHNALLVGHCPGVEDLAHLLAGSMDPEVGQRLSAKFPTSGIALLAFDTPWSDLGEGVARLIGFVVPRGEPRSDD